MASDNELKSNFTLQYQEMLYAIKVFDRDNPDNIAGHNALVDLARLARQRAEIVGITSLDPLPAEK
jgi:hypothetical protein